MTYKFCIWGDYCGVDRVILKMLITSSILQIWASVITYFKHWETKARSWLKKAQSFKWEKKFWRKTSVTWKNWWKAEVVSNLRRSRQVWNGPWVVKVIAAILSVYQYFLVKNLLWSKNYLGRKNFCQKVFLIKINFDG